MTLFSISHDAYSGWFQKLFCCLSTSAVHPSPRDDRPALSVVPSTESADEGSLDSVGDDRVTDFSLSSPVAPKEVLRLEDHSHGVTIVSMPPLSDGLHTLRRIRKFRKSTAGAYAQDIAVDLDAELVAEDLGVEQLSESDFKRAWLRARAEVHGFKEFITDFRRRFSMAKDAGLFAEEPVEILQKYAAAEEMYTVCFRLAVVLGMGTPIVCQYAYVHECAFPDGDYKIRYLAGRKCLINQCNYEYQYAKFKPKCLLCKENAISAIYNNRSLKPQEKLNHLVNVIDEMYQNLKKADEMIPIRR